MSNTATVVALKNAGDSITIGVESCKLMEIGKYPEVEFLGMDGSRAVSVRVNKASADKQLARIGLDYDSAAGKILTLSRSANPSDPTKPYWNINLAGTMPKTNGKPPVQRVAPEDLPDEPPPIEEAYNQTTPPPDRLGGLTPLHDRCLTQALKAAQRMKEAGYQVTDASVTALCAQLFIAATR